MTASAAPRARSKEHNLESLEHCGAEVQKGNPPEERKIQRLFRRGEATRLIKRCNDFGAGGVSVAIGELADGLRINLNKVPKKYEGLDGTELAISESQERMAVRHRRLATSTRSSRCAREENLEATVGRRGHRRCRACACMWNGNAIVDLSREFLAMPTARRSSRPCMWARRGAYERTWEGETLAQRMNAAGHRPERMLATRACPSASTPPSARPRYSCPSAARTS